MPFQEDLEHAWRRWQAEEENARRLALKSRLILTACMAVFGIVLAQGLEILGGGKYPGGTTGLRMGFLTAVGMVCLMICLVILLIPSRRRDERRMTSWRLAIPEEVRAERESYFDTLQLGEGDDLVGYRAWVLDTVRRENAQETRDAATALLDANTAESGRLRWAQALLVLGMVSLVSAGGIWVYNQSVEELGGPNESHGSEGDRLSLEAVAPGATESGADGPAPQAGNQEDR